MNVLKNVILVITLFLILFPPFVNAQDIALKKEAINPGSFYYSFKRVWEKGWGKLQFSQDAIINYHLVQLKTRLAELHYVIEEKLTGEVQQSSERFAFTAGKLTEELVKQNKQEEKQKVIDQFKQYSKYLEGLRDRYPANSSYWMLVQHDINALTILSESLK